MQARPNVPYHHYLATVEVAFEVEEGFTSTTLTAVVINDEQCLPAHKLAQAQQLIAAKLTNKLGDKLKAVHDTTLLYVSYLGQMTPEYFNSVPKQVEVPVFPVEPQNQEKH